MQRATTDWVFATLPDPNNVDNATIGDRSLRGDGLSAEVVYAGGGNAMVLFAVDSQAHQFARQLSRVVLERAPGLQIVLKRKQFDPDTIRLRDCLQDLHQEMSRRKMSQPASTPLLGLGVTAACVFTGAPAVVPRNGLISAEARARLGVEEGQLRSAEVWAKLGAEEQGKERLKRYLPRVGQAGYHFIYNFDQFGSKGESSYLAVIHTDGNDMGERIKAVGHGGSQAGSDVAADNLAYARALRRFSMSVQTAEEAALQKTVDVLLDAKNLTSDPDNPRVQKLGGVVPIPEIGGKKYLPFRPIVFGGDDVTFVCEGRLGLTLAANYIAEFSGQLLDDGKYAYARAGVAVVKSHYPFSRAYDLSEDLCKSAKRYIRDRKGEGPGLTALDWHFAVGGLVLPLEEVRKREFAAAYRVSDKACSLLMRPLRLNNPAGDWRSWQTFTLLMGEFRNEGPDGKWAGRRNKIKALRDALRNGPDAVSVFLQGEVLPKIQGKSEMGRQGWQGNECGYFDAIEALDFYVPLEGALNP